jgi:hypothetical protein
MAKKDRRDEDGDIALVEELVFSPCGLMLERIAQGGTKTPDGWILKYNQRRALCEIKSPRDDELMDALDEARESDAEAPIVGARLIRQGNLAARRLAGRVKDAVSQFNAVNWEHTFPNVLIFVNHAAGWHAGDLEEALTGYFHARDGTKLETERKTAAQIGDARRKIIDLYIWINRREQRIRAWLRGGVLDEHDATITDLFLPEMRKARAPEWESSM